MKHLQRLHLNHFFFQVQSVYHGLVGCPRCILLPDLGKTLVCYLLFLTYTFTHEARTNYQPFLSQKSNRWFCSLLALAEGQAEPQQSVRPCNNPSPPPSPPQQHPWLTGGMSEDGRDGAVPLAPLRVQTHALTSQQHVTRQVDKKSLGWVEDPWASGPALLTSVTFLGKIATERQGSIVTLPAFLSAGGYAPKAAKNMLVAHGNIPSLNLVQALLQPQQGRNQQQTLPNR